MSLKNLQELTQIKETLGSGFFTEAKGYDSSSDFTDEFYGLFHDVTKMKKIMKNPKWLDYMKLTDSNMETSTTQPAKDAIKAIVSLENYLNQIDKEFDKANGHSDEDDESDYEGEYNELDAEEDK